MTLYAVDIPGLMAHATAIHEQLIEQYCSNTTRYLTGLDTWVHEYMVLRKTWGGGDNGSHVTNNPDTLQESWQACSLQQLAKQWKGPAVAVCLL